DALWADGKFRHGIGEKDDGKHLYDAATKLRELYERAAPAMGMSSVQDRNWSGGRRELIGDEGAWWSYNTAMRQIGQWKGVVRAVVIEDRTPEDYGRQYHCYGLSALTTGLERLARHFGIAA